MSPSSIDTLMAALDRYPLRHGLLDFIHGVWEGRPEFDEAFSAEQTAQLNRAYLVIGMTALDDDTHRYLFLDRAGRVTAERWFKPAEYLEEQAYGYGLYMKPYYCVGNARVTNIVRHPFNQVVASACEYDLTR